MLHDPYTVAALVVAFSLAVLYRLAAAVRAPSRTGALNNLLTVVMGLGLLLVATGWTIRAAMLPLLVVLSAAIIWFVAQAAMQGRPWARTPGWGAGGCLYRAFTLGVALWILASALPASGTVQPQGHQLGSILGALIGAIVMTLVCAAWLLGTFATPKQDTTAQPIPRLRGLSEALMAGGLALTLFAMA
jgi:hypothetical protein